MTNDTDISPEAVEQLAHHDDIGGDALRFAPTLRALSAALTQSRAETAAAYEVAAKAAMGHCYAIMSATDADARAALIAVSIRALATPDQTAALDKLIAEAEALAVEKTAAMVRTWRNTTPMTGEECANAILAAIPEGGDA